MRTGGHQPGRSGRGGMGCSCGSSCGLYGAKGRWSALGDDELTREEAAAGETRVPGAAAGGLAVLGPVQMVDEVGRVVCSSANRGDGRERSSGQWREGERGEKEETLDPMCAFIEA
jgi:hypothetical protein